MHFGEISVRLAGSAGQRGVLSWVLAGYDGSSDAVDGLPTTTATAVVQREPSLPHPNGAHTIDHLVLRTSDGPRTEAALASVGFELLKRNSTVRAGVVQSFYRPSATTIELIAPFKTKDVTPTLPVTVWGFTFVCQDLEACHRKLRSSTKPPWDAVQPGRRITVLRCKMHGITPMVAFMSPHVKHTADEMELRRRAASQEAELRGGGRRKPPSPAGGGQGSRL